MREIKFRAWNLDKKFMLDNCLRLEKDRIVEWVKLQYTKNVIWLQYTGLKDKNGKEIYEGDIIDIYQLIPTTGHEAVHSFTQAQEVVFHEGRFGINMGGIHMLKDAIPYVVIVTIPEIIGDFGQIKVIGNIYENPEMLK